MGAGAWKQAGVALKQHPRAYIWFCNPEAERGREEEIGRQGNERVVCCGV